jgi:aldose 1-epimerase
MLNIDGDQISIGIDLDQGARLASVQWRDMQFVVPFRGQNYTWGWFSMVPYAGRIKNGIIRDLKGKTYQLPNNFDPPHAQFGFGATSSWEDIGNGAQHLVLPAPFDGASVTQRFEILGNALRWSLDYEPANCELPVSLGFHPWFARDIGRGDPAEIFFNAKKMFEIGDDKLPTGNFISPTDSSWDDTFTELTGTPEIIWPGACRITMEFDSPYFMLYSNDDEGICFEPVTAPPDAQNLGITGTTYLETLITFYDDYLD